VKQHTTNCVAAVVAVLRLKRGSLVNSGYDLVQFTGEVQTPTMYIAHGHTCC
jgi:hypothetical protein